MVKKMTPKWLDCQRPTEGLAVVLDKDSREYGYIDLTGQLAIPCQWNRAEPFHEGKAAVLNNDYEWGYIDKTGELVIPCQWEKVTKFTEGRAAVQDPDGDWGIIDETGRQIVPCHYYEIGLFENGFARVESLDPEGIGIVDKEGREVIPCKDGHTDIKPFSDGRFAVCNEDYLWGFYDNTGKCVVPHIYKDVESFHEGLAFVQDEDEKWGVIDIDGNVVTPCQWSDINRIYYTGDITAGVIAQFHGGYAAVKDEKRLWGVIDKTGQVVIPCQWWDIMLLNRDGVFALVQNNQRCWGTIDNQAQEVIPCQYAGKSFLSEEGLFVWDVKTERKQFESIANAYVVTDIQGNIVIDSEKFKALNLRPGRMFQDGLLDVQDNNTNKYGFINTQGELVIPCQWKHVWEFKNGFALVEQRGGNKLCIDKEGNYL